MSHFVKCLLPQQASDKRRGGKGGIQGCANREMRIGEGAQFPGHRRREDVRIHTLTKVKVTFRSHAGGQRRERRTGINKWEKPQDSETKAAKLNSAVNLIIYSCASLVACQSYVQEARIHFL